MKQSPPASRRHATEERADVRERLLDAAEALFAERGYAATSVRHITSAAECNVAAVNYYFGGKDNLYRETFARLAAVVRRRRIAGLERARSRSAGKDGLEEVLRSAVEAFLEPLLDRSSGGRYMQLISCEILDPHLPPGFMAKEMIEPVRAAFVAAFRGIFRIRDESAARLCIQSLFAQIVHSVHVQRLQREPDPADAPLAREIVDHIVRFSAGGIRACLGEPAASRR